MTAALTTTAPISYVDAASGCRIVASTPAADPVLWERYLEGAVTTYRRHGVSAVVAVDDIADGRSTALFFAAVDDAGEVHAGMRVQGPYLRAEESHALVEFAGAASFRTVRRHIAARIPEGIIEVKTAWVSTTAPFRRELAVSIPRTSVHAADLLGVRHVFATSAVHSLQTWCTTGAELLQSVIPIAYPDERYRTSMIVLDREEVPWRAEPAQLRELVAEQAQLHLADSFAAAA